MSDQESLEMDESGTTKISADQAVESTAESTPETGDRALTERAVVQLSSLVEAVPAVERHLSDILDRELNGQPTSDTFGSLGRRLADYLGDDLTSWLFMLLTSNEPEEILGWAEKVKGVETLPQVLDVLRWLRAIYAQDVKDAYTVWQEPMNGWARVARQVQYDQLTAAWLLELEITKFTGEVSTIAGSPTSILDLTRYILATLNTLPGGSSWFGQDSVDVLLEEFETFRHQFLEDESSASAQASPSSETAVPSPGPAELS